MEYADLPDWARAIGSSERLERLQREVLGSFEARGIPVELHDGYVVAMGAGDQPGQRWGLTNLLQACARAPESRWAEIVDSHFTTVLELERTTQDSRLDSIDYNVVAANLAVRLWEPSALGELAAKKLVTREDIPGLLTVLSMDMPQAVRTIPSTESDLWGRTRDQLFERAIANLTTQARPKIDSQTGPGGRLAYAVGESHFVSSMVLRIEEMPEMLGKHGSFIGVPTRHVILAAPFDDMESMAGFEQVIAITRRWYDDGPGSVSPRVWWCRIEDGTAVWREVVCEEVDGRMTVTPPTEFVELLEELGGL